MGRWHSERCDIPVSSRTKRNARVVRWSDECFGRGITVSANNGLATLTKGVTKVAGFFVGDKYLYDRTEYRSLAPMHLRMSARVHRLSFAHPSLDPVATRRKLVDDGGGGGGGGASSAPGGGGGFTGEAAAITGLAARIESEQRRLSRDGIVADHFRRKRDDRIARKRGGPPRKHAVKGVRRIVVKKDGNGARSYYSASGSGPPGAASMGYDPSSAMSGKRSRLSKSRRMRSKGKRREKKLQMSRHASRFESQSTFPVLEGTVPLTPAAYDTDDDAAALAATAGGSGDGSDFAEALSYAGSGMAFAGVVTNNPSIARMGRFLPEIACRVPNSSVAMELANARGKVRGTQPFVVEAPHILWGTARDLLFKRVADEGSPFADGRTLENADDDDLERAEGTESLMCIGCTIWVDVVPDESRKPPPFADVTKENALNAAARVSRAAQRTNSVLKKASPEKIRRRIRKRRESDSSSIDDDDGVGSTDSVGDGGAHVERRPVKRDERVVTHSLVERLEQVSADDDTQQRTSSVDGGQRRDETDDVSASASEEPKLRSVRSEGGTVGFLIPQTPDSDQKQQMGNDQTTSIISNLGGIGDSDDSTGVSSQLETATSSKTIISDVGSDGIVPVNDARPSPGTATAVPDFEEGACQRDDGGADSDQQSLHSSAGNGLTSYIGQTSSTYGSVASYGDGISTSQSRGETTGPRREQSGLRSDEIDDPNFIRMSGNSGDHVSNAGVDHARSDLELSHQSLGTSDREAGEFEIDNGPQPGEGQMTQSSTSVSESCLMHNEEKTRENDNPQDSTSEVSQRKATSILRGSTSSTREVFDPCTCTEGDDRGERTKSVVIRSPSSDAGLSDGNINVDSATALECSEDTSYATTGGSSNPKNNIDRPEGDGETIVTKEKENVSACDKKRGQALEQVAVENNPSEEHGEDNSFSLDVPKIKQGPAHSAEPGADHISSRVSDIDQGDNVSTKGLNLDLEDAQVSTREPAFVVRAGPGSITSTVSKSSGHAIEQQGVESLVSDRNSSRVSDIDQRDNFSMKGSNLEVDDPQVSTREPAVVVRAGAGSITSTVSKASGRAIEQQGVESLVSDWNSSRVSDINQRDNFSTKGSNLEVEDPQVSTREPAVVVRAGAGSITSTVSKASGHAIEQQGGESLVSDRNKGAKNGGVGLLDASPNSGEDINASGKYISEKGDLSGGMECGGDVSGHENNCVASKKSSSKLKRAVKMSRIGRAFKSSSKKMKEERSSQSTTSNNRSDAPAAPMKPDDGEATGAQIAHVNSVEAANHDCAANRDSEEQLETKRDASLAEEKVNITSSAPAKDDIVAACEQKEGSKDVVSLRKEIDPSKTLIQSSSDTIDSPGISNFGSLAHNTDGSQDSFRDSEDDSCFQKVANGLADNPQILNNEQREQRASTPVVSVPDWPSEIDGGSMNDSNTIIHGSLNHSGIGAGAEHELSEGTDVKRLSSQKVRKSVQKLRAVGVMKGTFKMKPQANNNAGQDATGGEHTTVVGSDNNNHSSIGEAVASRTDPYVPETEGTRNASIVQPVPFSETSPNIQAARAIGKGTFKTKTDKVKRRETPADRPDVPQKDEANRVQKRTSKEEVSTRESALLSDTSLSEIGVGKDIGTTPSTSADTYASDYISSMTPTYQACTDTDLSGVRHVSLSGGMQNMDDSGLESEGSRTSSDAQCTQQAANMAEACSGGNHLRGNRDVVGHALCDPADNSSTSEDIAEEPWTESKDVLEAPSEDGFGTSDEGGVVDAKREQDELLGESTSDAGSEARGTEATPVGVEPVQRKKSKKPKPASDEPSPYVLVLDDVLEFKVVGFPYGEVLATFPVSVASVLGERSMEERMADPLQPSELTVTLCQEPSIAEKRWGVEAVVTFRCAEVHATPYFTVKSPMKDERGANQSFKSTVNQPREQDAYSAGSKKEMTRALHEDQAKEDSEEDARFSTSLGAGQRETNVKSQMFYDPEWKLVGRQGAHKSAGASASSQTRPRNDGNIFRFSAKPDDGGDRSETTQQSRYDESQESITNSTLLRTLSPFDDSVLGTPRNQDSLLGPENSLVSQNPGGTTSLGQFDVRYPRQSSSDVFDSYGRAGRDSPDRSRLQLDEKNTTHSHSQGQRSDGGVGQNYGDVWRKSMKQLRGLSQDISGRHSDSEDDDPIALMRKSLSKSSRSGGVKSDKEFRRVVRKSIAKAGKENLLASDSTIPPSKNMNSGAKSTVRRSASINKGPNRGGGTASNGVVAQPLRASVRLSKRNASHDEDAGSSDKEGKRLWILVAALNAMRQATRKDVIIRYVSSLGKAWKRRFTVLVKKYPGIILALAWLVFFFHSNE